MSTGPDHAELSPDETGRVRSRVQQLLAITVRCGRFRGGLLQATARLTPEEGVIVADLEQRGLDVIQLRDLLHGAHVLVDQPELYQRWRFPSRSHQRISSHHPEVDKSKFPDYGMRGPLVREKLHGRTLHGTWLQLEKTPATMQAGKINVPSLTDLRHLTDYFIYRITRSNVGPWGRSGATERRPMYLSPDLGVTVPIPEKVGDELTGVISELEQHEDVTSASPDLAARFAPPARANDLRELSFSGTAQGRGLFGSASVWGTPSSPRALELLEGQGDLPGWTPPETGPTRPVSLRLGGGRELSFSVRIGSSGA